MDTTRIIRGTINSMGYTVTSAITQWDYGWIFIPEFEDIPATYRLDFSNDEHHGTALPVYCGSDGAEVPEELIDTGMDIWVWFYYIGDGYGNTEYKWRIPNECKPKTAQDEPTPSQQSSIDHLIAVSSEAVATASQKASDADASAQSAQGYAEQAETARDTAQTYANNAQTSATQASASASQASASATASAQSANQSAQIKSDVEELAGDVRGYANSAQQSASDADQSARESAESARASGESALSASNSALSSGEYASNALGHAESASTSAQTALDKASESAQSATNAQTYANTAEQAKTASQTAQGLAESARDSAITAKNDAESAKADAESARDEAQQAVASISGALADKADVITDTASGAVASFTDGADDLPLKSLVVNIDPVQDLHGYDSPWVGGGGKNLFDATLMRDQSAWYNIPVKVKPNTVYTMSSNKGTQASTGLAVYFNNTNTQCGGSATLVYSSQSVTITSTSEGYVYVSQRRVSGEDSFQNYHYQIEEGSTATAWTPYENICPISGWDGANVWADGKNLLDPTLLKEQAAWNTIRFYAPVGTALTFSTNQQTRSTSGLIVFFRHPTESMTTTNNVYVNHPVTKIVRNTGYVEVVQRNADNISSFADWEYQIEIGDEVVTSYEPYQGQTIPITWQTEAGTVYSGKLDVLSGILTVYPYYASYNGEALTGEWISDRDVYAVGATPTIGAQVVNIGAEGTEYQLDPHEIASLLGTNNIFADTGDTACEYRADTKLYIAKKIAEAISALS